MFSGVREQAHWEVMGLSDVVGLEAIVFLLIHFNPVNPVEFFYVFRRYRKGIVSWLFLFFKWILKI